MVAPRIAEKRLPVAGIPGKLPLVCAGDDPLQDPPRLSSEAGGQLDREIGDDCKGAIGEGSECFPATIDRAESYVLIDTVVSKEGKQLFRIVRRPGGCPLLKHLFHSNSCHALPPFLRYV